MLTIGPIQEHIPIERTSHGLGCEFGEKFSRLVETDDSTVPVQKHQCNGSAIENVNKEEQAGILQASRWPVIRADMPWPR